MHVRQGDFGEHVHDFVRAVPALLVPDHDVRHANAALGVSLRQTANLVHDRFDLSGEGDEAVLGCGSPTSLSTLARRLSRFMINSTSAFFETPHQSRRPGGKEHAVKLKALIYKADEGGYWAKVPAIPGCVSQGETAVLGLSLQQTANLVHDRLDLPGEGDEAVLGCKEKRKRTGIILT